MSSIKKVKMKLIEDDTHNLISSTYFNKLIENQILNFYKT